MGLIVNGERIDKAAVSREAEAMRSEYERQFTEMDPADREAQLWEWATENVVERAVLHQEALRQGIPVDHQQVQETLARLKEESGDTETLFERMGCHSEQELVARLGVSTQTEALLARAQKRAAVPSPQDLRKAYEDNKSDFLSPERVSCAHLVKHVDGQTSEAQAVEIMQAAKAQLAQGVRFELLTERLSDCPDNGGSLGYIARGQMVEEFDDVVFNMGPGETSEVFRTRFGYHIATVYDRQAPQQQPFEAVKQQIERQLQEELNANAVYAYIDDLKAQAKIEESSD